MSTTCSAPDASLSARIQVIQCAAVIRVGRVRLTTVGGLMFAVLATLIGPSTAVSGTCPDGRLIQTPAERKESDLGVALGRGLADGRLVVRGVIRQVEARSVQTPGSDREQTRVVVIEVSEILAGGDGTLSRTLPIDAGLIDKATGGAQLLDEWRSASMTEGVLVLAVLRYYRAGDEDRYTADVVVSGVALETLESAVSWHKSVATKGRSFDIAGAVMLSANHAFLGYLLGLSMYPATSSVLSEPERMQLLAALVQSEKTPGYGRLEAVRRLSRSLGRDLGDPALEGRLVETVIDASSSPTLGRYAVGYLADAVERGSIDISQRITPDVKDRLLANYRSDPKRRISAQPKFAQQVSHVK